MLPTRQQVEERLNSLGYKPQSNFYGQPHGRFIIYNNKALHSDIRLHYLELPEIGLGPYYVLSFPMNKSLFGMNHQGIETLHIETERDLDKIIIFIDEYHSLFAYREPWHYQGSQYEPKDGGWGWIRIMKNWADAVSKGSLESEEEWRRWRDKFSQEVQ